MKETVVPTLRRTRPRRVLRLLIGGICLLSLLACQHRSSPSGSDTRNTTPSHRSNGANFGYRALKSVQLRLFLPVEARIEKVSLRPSSNLNSERPDAVIPIDLGK
ncbi:MAG: hypothetical protein KC609_19370, partial [Myxococcales bacterium]|nr:hypothetical protein [Myxococcales bacterium]